MRWYLVANDRALHHYWDHLLAAVASARANAPTLKPRLLYSGPDIPRLAALGDLGVEVVHHDVPFLDALRAKTRIDERPHFRIEIARGAYLDTSICLVEQEEEVVVYTDLDVLILKPLEPPPPFETAFAAAPEVFGDVPTLNSGVMFVNVPRMRAVHPRYVEYVVGCDFNYEPGLSHYDQGSLNSFFKQDWTRLPSIYNWRPFLGVSEEARILHFHGPKAWMVKSYLGLGEPEHPTPEGHRSLYMRDPAAYAQAYDLYSRYLEEARARLTTDYPATPTADAPP